MKFKIKNIFKYKILIISILCFFSCKKKEITNLEPIDIDYPKAYIVNGGSNNISILNLTDLTVSKTIQLTEVGRFPHHINLSPDGKKLAVATPEFDFTLGHTFWHNATNNKGGVTIIDAQNGATLLKIPLSNINFNAVFSPDGKEIWTATSTHTGEMFVFDAITGIQKNKIILDADPSEVAFSKDGQNAYVALGESSFVYAINTSTKAITKSIKVDAYPTNVWAGSDGKIYVENKTSQSVNIIDTKTLTAVEAIDLNFKPSQIAYNQALNELWVCQAGGNQVAFFERKNNVWSLKSSIITGDDAHAISFSKDEKTAYVVNQKGNSVSLIDAINHTKTKDISVGNQPNGIVLKE